MEKEEQVNLKEYGFEQGQQLDITLDGNVFTGILEVLERLVEDQTSEASFIDFYPTTTQPNFVKFEGEQVIDNVEINWSRYPNLNSYFSQQPVRTTSLLGVMALDLLIQMRGKHKELVDLGIAKHISELKATNDDN